MKNADYLVDIDDCIRVLWYNAQASFGTFVTGDSRNTLSYEHTIQVV